MHIVHIVAAHPAGTDPVTPAVVGDVVWAHAQPGHHLEHLHVARLDATSVRLVLFLRATSSSAALAAARALVGAACVGALHDWHITAGMPAPLLAADPLGTAPRFDPS